MALEGRNIAGQAQIYNQTQNAVNQYAKTLQQQQLQREREAKVLTDELSKVKLDGIRQPDIPEFTNKYREVKDLFAKRLAARKPEEKIALDSEFKTKMLELSEIAEDSKALAKGEVEFSKMLLNPNIRDRYADDAVDRFQRAKALARKDPNYVRDLTTLEQQVDLSKIMDDLNKVDDTLLKSSQWQRAEQKGVQGNREGVFVSNIRSIDPQQQAIAYAAEFDLKPKFRVALRQMFPQLADLPNEQLKAVGIPELVKQRVRTETDKTQFKANDTFFRNLYAQDKMIRSRKADGVGEGDESTYRQQVIEGIMNNDKESVDEMKSYLPSGSSVEFKTSRKTNDAKGGYNFIRVDIPAVIDPNGTIKNQGIKEDISLSKGDAKNRLNAILNQYSGEKITPSKLNIKGGKPRGEQVEIKAPSKSPSVQQEKSNKKVIKGF